MAGLRNLLANVSTRGRIVLAASFVGIGLVAFLLFRVASAPDYATLASGIDPAETGKITAALDEKGIPYELQNNGTALAVEKSRSPEARIALAEQGIPGTSEKGWELFDEQALGASDLQQRVNYQRALEGEISRTMQEIKGVSGAEVQLVLPEEQLFAEEEAPSTAAVMLSGDIDAIEPSSVRGMAQLVSSSVRGLKPANVSITGSDGSLLWPRDDGSGDGSGGGMSATSKQAAEMRYERQLEGGLNGLILQTLGPDKARVQVNADLNTDKATRDELRYGRRRTALKRKTEQEGLRGGGAGGGAAGTAGNIPPYVTGGTGGGADSNYRRRSDEIDNGVNKTVTRTEVAPGAVNRKSVALVVDDTVPPGEVDELRRAIEGAAGLDNQRGDTISVSQIAFARPPVEAAEGPISGIGEYVRYGALGLACLAFLFFVARHLRGREQEGLAREPMWLREMNAPMSLSEFERTQLAAPAEPPPLQGDELEMVQQQTRRRVEDLVAREPERVAQQVRAWMSED